MVETTVGLALKEYGSSLEIASTAAIEKKGRTDEVRVLFDGSNGLGLNPGIRVRDQVKYPTAADTKGVMAEAADEGGPHFSLFYDILKAHRRCAVDRSDWGRQACQIKGTAAGAARAALEKDAKIKRMVFESTGTRQKARLKPRVDDLSQEVLDEPLWLNKVGTFGVASAGYWWGRAGACAIRLTHYAAGHLHAIWAMLYSDDGWLIGRGEHYEFNLLLHFFVLMIVGTPLAWHKVGGGLEVDWIGYYLDVGRFEVGINDARATWARRWLSDKIRERTVALGELREGLGRLQFLAGPLEHLRPFLGPLYAWSCAGHRFLKPKLPVMLLLVMQFLETELGRSHMVTCKGGTKDLGELFRLDAKAEGEDVAIGGWLCRGISRTRDAPWFAVRLNRRNAPWAFSRGEAFRTIASLELLGALVSLMVLGPVPAGCESLIGTMSFTCGTDNRSNTYLLDKMMTTKYPLGVVLMELAAQTRLRGMVLRARWLPRLQNEEADALSNFEFDAFDPKLRIDAELENLPFVLLNDLFQVGDQYIAELDAVKKAKTVGQEAIKAKKGLSLRERDPW